MIRFIRPHRGSCNCRACLNAITKMAVEAVKQAKKLKPSATSSEIEKLAAEFIDEAKALNPDHSG